jgi:hypothetical protein
VVGCCGHANEPLGAMRSGYCPDQLNNCQLFEKDFVTYSYTVACHIVSAGDAALLKWTIYHVRKNLT